jgi:hypothetical protein
VAGGSHVTVAGSSGVAVLVTVLVTEADAA